MRCPLCKEVVEDKESLQVHYITSCKGYRSEGKDDVTNIIHNNPN